MLATRFQLQFLIFTWAAVLIESEPFSVKINGKNFPAEFCTNTGKAISLRDALQTGSLSLPVAARLIRFGNDICKMQELLKRNNSGLNALIGVFAQSSDMREFCRFNEAPAKSEPYTWIQSAPHSGCGKRSTNRGQHLAWEHLKLYRFQSCVLLCLMCLCCYIYGRVLSLRISPRARLRRLNWTTENFIWAYKNF